MRKIRHEMSLMHAASSYALYPLLSVISSEEAMPTFLHHTVNGVRQARATQPAAAHTHGTLEREARRTALHAGQAANLYSGVSRAFSTSPVPEAGPLTGGEPLPENARRQFEPKLGHDFGRVRIHRGPEAADSARALGARAFTIGSHIVFGQDRF